MKRLHAFLPVMTDFTLTFRCPACHTTVAISNEAAPPQGCPLCGLKYKVYLSILMDTAGTKPVRS